jgi:hypothetical protein
MRYLLENLPRAEIPGCGNSGTEKWQYIWKEAWTNAERASQKGDFTHPFCELIQQPKLLQKEIYHCGLRLYGTLSTNIHKYFVENAGTLLETTPLDEDQKYILKALTPNDGFDENTDWNAERMKLGIKIEPKTKGMQL